MGISDNTQKKYCTKCGNVLQIKEDWGYCDKCMLKFHIPQKTSVQNQPKKYCTRCGNVLRINGELGYCDICMLKFHIPLNTLLKVPITNTSSTKPPIKQVKNIKPNKYDMETLDGINSIPVPAKNYNTGDWTKDCIYYVLQRKATEHKRNKRLDLAIACLRKSNALSDYEKRPPLLEKDYLRLVKYLRLNGENDAADIEEQRIYSLHPEFKDKRISNLLQISNVLNKCKYYKSDLVYITTNSYCPACSKYNRKVFSISGKSKKYPKLPDVIVRQGGGCSNCILGITIKFE